MTDRAQKILATLDGLDALADLPRTGWLLRGVRPCESIAEHSYAVVLLTVLLVDELRAEGHVVDGEKALRMATVHDAAEACMGDVPMPVKSQELDVALTAAERALAHRLLPEPLGALWDELEAGTSLEARLVRCADKLQMLHRCVRYEQRGHRGLEDFWRNGKTFQDRGLDLVRELFEALQARHEAAH